MGKAVEVLRSYLATATAKGTWEKVLALLAMLCGALLSYAITITRGGEQGAGILLPAWSLPVLLPVAAYYWAKKRPARTAEWDCRLWLILATVPISFGLVALHGDRQDLEDLVQAALLLAVTFGITLVATLSRKRKSDAAAAWAEKHGWRLDGKHERALDWEDSWLSEMSGHEKLVNLLVLGSSGILFFASVALLLIAGGGFEGKGDLSPIFAAILACFQFSYMSLLCYSFFLIRRQFVQKKRGVAELEAARQMQMSLMPPKSPEIEGLDVAGVTVPTTEVGGDLFHYYEPPGIQGSVGIAVADVSGKGMKAAIATVLVSGMLRAERDRGDSPAEMLSAVNRGLLGGAGVAGFVAMQVLVVDGRMREARYSNAGQVHPLLLRKGTVETLALGGLPLGIDDAPGYEEVRLSLVEGEVLLLMSDGIVEAMNEKRELLGFDGVERFVRGLDASKPAAALRDELIGKAKAFQGRAQQQDDMTLVVVKIP